MALIVVVVEVSIVVTQFNCEPRIIDYPDCAHVSNLWQNLSDDNVADVVRANVACRCS